VLEELGDLALFPEQLLGVGEVLVLAAAAAGKERAHRRDAMRGRRENGDEVGLGKILVIAENAGADPSPGSVKGTIMTHFASASPGSGTRPRPTPRLVSVEISSSISA
jgi:hypothetical protein